MKPLTPALLEEYRQNGVVCVRRAFDQKWLDKLAAEIEQILANPGLTADQSIPSDTGRFFNGFFQWINHPGIRDYIYNSPAYEIAAFLMESKTVQFFYDQLLVKDSGTSQRTPWHTDADYFPIKGKKINSIWLPLERVTRENGGLQFIKGSHLRKPQDLIDLVPNKVSRDQGKGKYVLPDFDDYPDRFEFLHFDLEPGDCLVFHIDIIHMGHDNRSSVKRRALSTRWFGEGCHVDESKPHILNTPKIVEQIQRHGFAWNGSMDNPLFPKFLIK